MNHNIDIFDLFLMLFVGLKLSGHIDWSWPLVLSPLWIFIIYYMFSNGR